jgi:hypothetical protein
LFKKMSVKVEQEASILGGKLQVDFRFLEPRGKSAVKREVVMEVDGPYHYLLELPTSPGDQLPPDEQDLNTTVRRPGDGVERDGYEEMLEMFGRVDWGAPQNHQDIPSDHNCCMDQVTHW